MKRKFLISYQSTTFDSFSKHTSFHTLIITLDGIENDKQIPLKVLKAVQKHENEKYSSDFLPDVMIINFWEIDL